MSKGLSFIFIVFISFSLFSQDGNYIEKVYQCTDGVERPYILYSPNSIEKEEKSPLVVFLHGAISSKKIKKSPLEYIKKSKLIDLANKGKFHLMFSYGQRGATWFDSVGQDMVLSEIKNTISENNKIDHKKIFLSGFSDGASGVYYFSMTKPDIFAGFIMMNGHFSIANKLGESQLYPENMNNKPTYIINTKEDLLYPSAKIKPIIKEFKKYNKNIIFRELEGNHEMSYLPKEESYIIDFINKNQLNIATNFSWETSDLKSNKFQWLKISELDTLEKPKKWHHEYKLTLFNDKASLGVAYDYSYGGKGLKVAKFKNDSVTAKRIGIAKDDIILMMENDSIKNPYSPYYYLARKKAGEPIELTILRNGKKKFIKGNFNPGFNYELYKTTKKSGKITVNQKGNKIYINSSGVRKIDIDFEKLESKTRIKDILLNNKKIKIEAKNENSFLIK